MSSSFNQSWIIVQYQYPTPIILPVVTLKHIYSVYKYFNFEHKMYMKRDNVHTQSLAKFYMTVFLIPNSHTHTHTLKTRVSHYNYVQFKSWQIDSIIIVKSYHVIQYPTYTNKMKTCYAACCVGIQYISIML